MKKTVLILVTDEASMKHLNAVFDHPTVKSVLIFDTIHEICHTLGLKSHDLVVLPTESALSNIHLLRSIQPDVPIAVFGEPNQVSKELAHHIQLFIDTSGPSTSLSIMHRPPHGDQSTDSLVADQGIADERISILDSSKTQGRDIARRTSADHQTVAMTPKAQKLEGRPIVEAHKESESAGSPPRVGSYKEPLLAFLSFTVPRLAFAILILIFIIFFTYLGLDMAGGTELWQATKDAVPNSIDYLGRLARGDLGFTPTASSTAQPVPISDVLATWLPRSLGLLAISMVFASVVGLLLGIRAATRSKTQSLGIIIATIVGVSVPNFFAAFLLQYLVVRTTQFVGKTVLPVGGFGWDTHLILPVLVLSARPLAQITRISFVSISDVLQKDYVRTAHSKGLPASLIMNRHVFRNAAIPILTTIGVSLRFALTGLPIVEFYFGWLGAGYLLLKSISQQDEELTIALVLSLGIIFIVVNFLLEVSYRFLDPRLRTQPAYVATDGAWHPKQIIRSAWVTIYDLLTDNPLANWILQLRSDAQESPFKAAIERGDITIELSEDIIPPKGLLVRRILGNFPLVFGGLMVFLLMVIFIFGPNLAPNSPFTTLGLQNINGELKPPPFSPGDVFPWGTDPLGRGIMSLILAGARQTLTLAALAVFCRMLVGILLGAIAGWTSGSRLDRIIVGASEIISAYPTLLLAMIVILAIGIRQGMMPFIVALTLVGWGETMQFVRGEVVTIRPKPFIESAVALGARTPRIIYRHILPILFSSLISIGALEMGSVLMILGELGFINIFIGGGSLIELPLETILYSDVPEWGALLSNVRAYARSYPWTALYPMLAIFIAVLAFNLFGEGVRRLIAQGHLVINRIVNRYTLSIAVIGIIGALWLRQNMGAMPFYRQFARQFDGLNAFAYLTDLTDPAFDARSLDTGGMDSAADFIADEFEDLGLQAGGQKNTLFQERFRSYGSLDKTPEFTVDDGGPDPRYREDFAVYPSQSASLGEVTAPVRFIGLGKLSRYQAAIWRVMYPELEREDFSRDIVLVLSDREAEVMDYRARGGMLVVTDDPEKLKQNYTLGSLFFGWPSPRLWITEEMAQRILTPAGYTLEGLREEIDALPAEAVIDIPLAITATIKIEGTIEERVPVRNVIGLLPGTSGKEFCTICLGVELVVVMAQYDSPPIGPTGLLSDSANDNASGVAVMLEALRVMQESDYQPYRSFLFVAYSGEGLDGGAIVRDPDVNRFLQAKTGFTEFQLEAIVQLRGVGAGSGDRLLVSSGGSLRLADLFESSASQMGVDTVRADEAIDLGVVFEETASGGESVQKAPIVLLNWERWEDYARLPEDTVENISVDKLEQTGRTLAMALMVLGREQNY